MEKLLIAILALSLFGCSYTRPQEEAPSDAPRYRIIEGDLKCTKQEYNEIKRGFKECGYFDNIGEFALAEAGIFKPGLSREDIKKEVTAIEACIAKTYGIFLEKMPCDKVLKYKVARSGVGVFCSKATGTARKACEDFIKVEKKKQGDVIYVGGEAVFLGSGKIE
jgi:hypothetical protein